MTDPRERLREVTLAASTFDPRAADDPPVRARSVVIGASVALQLELQRVAEPQDLGDPQVSLSSLTTSAKSERLPGLERRGIVCGSPRPGKR